MKISTVFLLAVSIAICVSCTGSKHRKKVPLAKSEYEQSLNAESGKLDGRYWRLIELDGETITPKPQMFNDIYILFTTDGFVSGSAGCNRINGSYSVDGAKLSFGGIASTRRMCPEMDAEHKFMKMFPMVESFYTDENHLYLSDGAERVVAKFVATVM